MVRRFLTLGVPAVTAVLGSANTSAEVFYVDADATDSVHNGMNWCAAFQYLNDALGVADAGDTIRVANGTYRPDQGLGQSLGDRSSSFRLVAGVTLEGGYAGCGAPDPNERSVVANETVLSGDLSGNDQPKFFHRSDNCYHVLIGDVVDPSAVLDGFTITGGNADGADLNDRGGGMLLTGAFPRIRECVFRENQARLGGAINTEGGGPHVQHVVFAGNSAGFSGGAIRAWQSQPLVEDCLFTTNQAEAGGGMWFGASTPVIRNCTFVENTAPLGNALSFDSCCPQQPSLAEISDGILWDGGNEVFVADGSAVLITYSIVGGGFLGSGNSSEDPRFVPGPWGCHYLSQIASGGMEDSPGVDTGDSTAAAVGLSERTTRRDEAGDDGLVDLGYHFPITGRTLMMGDWDRSGRLDLRDIAALQRCFTNGGPVEVTPCCRGFDFEPDADVDLDDVVWIGLDVIGP
jgi:predicted outer membrane repeat protein